MIRNEEITDTAVRKILDTSRYWLRYDGSVNWPNLNDTLKVVIKTAVDEAAGTPVSEQVEKPS